MSRRMRKHILEAQLAEDTGTTRTADGNDGGGASPFASTLTLEACKCKHLQKWLPHVLDLTCAIIPNEKEDHWIMANPIHALHMASQLEPDGATVILPKEQPHGEPALYGEEQLRSKAIITNGISPAVEFISVSEQDEEYGNEYATRTLVLPNRPSSVASTVPPKQQPQQQQQQHKSTVKMLSSTTQGVEKNIPIMPHQQKPRAPYNAAATSASRRPALPSGIVPPSASSNIMLPTSAPFQGQRANFMPLPPMNPIPAARMAAPTRTQGSGMPPPPRTSASSNPSLPFAPPPQNVATARTRLNNDPNFLLDEQRYEELRRKEQALLLQRHVGPARRKLSLAQTKKKKKQRIDTPVPLLPNGLFTKTVYQLNSLSKWQHDARLARATVEEWMERFRLCRTAHWQEKNESHGEIQQCQECSKNGGQYSCDAGGDELMQCLECSFIGCGPQALLEESNQHMMHHMLLSGHCFAVTCGECAEVFCFKCGDFVYHQVFDQERERIDICQRLPWMGWHDGPIQRSFDAVQFLNTPEHGVVWRGMIASYPPRVPHELVQAGRLSMQRFLVNRGELSSPSSQSWGSKALRYATYQNQNDSKHGRQIQAPVGMYNLGNTCFMTCILQCLIHCVPLQHHFLGAAGHHHKSCEHVRSAYRQNDATSSDQFKSAKPTNDEFDKSNICLACEMDKLYLHYLGSSIGQDVTQAVCQVPHPLDRYETPVPLMGSTRGTAPRTKYGGLDEAYTTCLQGDPLVTTKLLAAAWKCGGMDHLAGYEQGDAHEFLQAFLDTVGKHAGEYRKLLRFMQRMALPSTAVPGTNAASSQENDIIKRLFEGTLRSVLICDECGCKRKMPETFLNVSLPLSRQVQEQNAAEIRGSKVKMSLERCLEHFTSPESLADPVDCPQCMKKTPTRKQHTFAKLPKVLCLHLKRFDAAKNRKIDDFVSFPAHGLDMGQFLPHWCETRLGESSSTQDDNATSPRVLYDIFATANHTGTLHQGHYVANVKVGSNWFHCNDAHVSNYDESRVLSSEGAYVLFYIRR